MEKRVLVIYMNFTNDLTDSYRQVLRLKNEFRGRDINAVSVKYTDPSMKILASIFSIRPYDMEIVNSKLRETKIKVLKQLGKWFNIPLIVLEKDTIDRTHKTLQEKLGYECSNNHILKVLDSKKVDVLIIYGKPVDADLIIPGTTLLVRAKHELNFPLKGYAAFYFENSEVFFNNFVEKFEETIKLRRV